MGTFVVKDPTGKEFEVTAPEGASEADVLAYAQKSFGSAPTDTQKIQASIPGRMVQGVRDAIDAGAQMVTRALPESVVSGVNNATDALNRVPVLGDAMVAMGMTPATPQQIDQGIVSNEQQYQRARQATGSTGLDLARIGGSMAITTPLAAAAPMGGVGMLGRMAAGAGTGAALSAGTQPVVQNQDNFLEEKGKQAMLGGAVGALSPIVASLLSKLVSGSTNPQVRTLMEEGVTPTPGQIIGGVARQTEDKLTSIPVLGDAINASRRAAVEELNRAAYNRALNPIGQKAGQEVGREGVAAVRNALDQAYEAIKPRITFRTDPQLQQEISTIRSMVQQSLPPELAGRFDQILRSQVANRLTPQGNASGETYKVIESEINRFAQGMRGDASFDMRQLGNALNEVLGSLRSSLVRTNPADAQVLQKINEGWANYARIRDAASRAGANNGIMTPAGLAAAARAGDKSVGKGATAQGTAFMQDLTDAGKAVLGGGYPDSGTVGRGLLSAGVLGGGYAINPAIAAGTVASTIPYLPGGRQAAAAILARRPEWADPLAKSLNNGLPSALQAIAPGFLAQQQ